MSRLFPWLSQEDARAGIEMLKCRDYFTAAYLDDSHPHHKQAVEVMGELTATGFPGASVSDTTPIPASPPNGTADIAELNRLRTGLVTGEIQPGSHEHKGFLALQDAALSAAHNSASGVEREVQQDAPTGFLGDGSLPA